MTIRSIKSVAVFCGSNFGASEAFADGARALGGALGEAGITIIYGGTVKGLMGVVADAALEAGGSVHVDSGNRCRACCKSQRKRGQGR